MIAAVAALAFAYVSPTVAFLPADIAVGVQYASWTRDESRDNLCDSIAKFANRMLHRNGCEIVDPADVSTALKKLDSHVAKDKKISDFDALDSELKTDYVVLVELDRIDQGNRSSQEIGADPARPASITKVQARLWVYSRSAHAFVGSSETKFDGSARGSFFGTTNVDEMSGSPSDKAAFVRLENRKRMDNVAKAVWAAIKSPIETAIPTG